MVANALLVTEINDPVACTTGGQHPMYITDHRHFLDQRGGIGSAEGSGRTMAQFQVVVVAHSSDAAGQPPAAPRCFKCRKHSVEAGLARDFAIVWTCPNCRAEGRISSWKGSLWDLSDRPVARP